MRLFCLALLLSACTSPLLRDLPRTEMLAAQTRVNERSQAVWEFHVKVKGEPFNCKKSYLLGSDRRPVKFKDLRFFISNFSLHDKEGKAHPLHLVESPWQTRGVALLDFENQTSRCQGSPETHQTIEAWVEPGSYTAISFSLGIPFGLNHQIPDIARPPFDTRSLYQSRRAGYYFLKADLSVLGRPGIFPIRLSSQGCHGQGIPESHVQTYKAQHLIDENPDELPSYCDSSHRPRFKFEVSDVLKQRFTIDLGHWLEVLSMGSLSTEGCTSAEGDSPACAELYRNLGLYFQGKTAHSQRFVTISTQ